MCVTTYHWGQTINHYIWDEKVFEPHNRRALRQTTGPNCGRVILRCECRFFHMEHEILMVLQIFDMNKFEYLNIVILWVPFAANFCCAVTPTYTNFLRLPQLTLFKQFKAAKTASYCFFVVETWNETKREDRSKDQTNEAPTSRTPQLLHFTTKNHLAVCQ